MPRLPCIALVGIAAGILLAASGCTGTHLTTLHARTASHTFALVVTVNGGTEPTAEQWASLREKFSAELAARGFTLVDDAAKAGNVIHVNFVSDPSDPTSGRAVVLSIASQPSGFSLGYPGAGDYGANHATVRGIGPVFAVGEPLFTPISRAEKNAPPAMVER